MTRIEVIDQLKEQGYNLLGSCGFGDHSFDELVDENGNSIILRTVYGMVSIYVCPTATDGSLYPCYLADPFQVCDALTPKQ